MRPEPSCLSQSRKFIEMIISDVHRLAFIHIPKCAGTSVRSQLGHLNDCQLTGAPWIDTDGPSYIKKHKDLGLVYHGHLPLFVLDKYFPNEFAKLKTYWNFCVLRDPYDRFASALLQHIKEYCKRPFNTYSHTEIRTIVYKIIDDLLKLNYNLSILPINYTHFRRQSDYIYLNNQKVIKNLYSVDMLDELFDEIERITGEALPHRSGPAHLAVTNRSVSIKNDVLRRIEKNTRSKIKFLVKLLPRGITNSLKNLVYLPLNDPRNTNLHSVLSEDYVQNFIRAYYEDDIALYRRFVATGDKKSN